MSSKGHPIMRHFVLFGQASRLSPLDQLLVVRRFILLDIYQLTQRTMWFSFDFMGDVAYDFVLLYMLVLLQRCSCFANSLNGCFEMLRAGKDNTGFINDTNAIMK